MNNTIKKKNNIRNSAVICIFGALLLGMIAGGMLNGTGDDTSIFLVEERNEFDLSRDDEGGALMDVPVCSATYTEHSNISLNGNAEVDAFFAGNGTDGLSWDTAYVIEGWNITVETSQFIGNAINLQNSDRYIIIQDCYVGGSSINHNTNIYINATENVIVQDCIFNTTIMAEAIGVEYSQNITVEGCLLLNQSYGIAFQYCNDMVITNNTITNSLSDITMLYTSNVMIKENHFNESIENLYGNTLTILNNTSSATDIFDIWLLDTSDANIVYNTWLDILNFQNVTDFLICGNEFTADRTLSATLDSDCENGLIYNNAFSGTNSPPVTSYAGIDWDNGEMGNFIDGT